MAANIDEQDGCTVLRLSGDVDLAASPALRKTLMELMFERREVVIDLAAVTYMDSSGVAGLVEAYQMARKNGSRFVLAQPSDPVKRVLQLARLDRVFTIADSLDAALKG
jgi:anti-sigma B factor antagonist